MLGIAHWSTRRKAAIAATLAFLLWFPTGLSESSAPIVTGHSTFYNGQGFDKCLASIVGVMQTEVRWFNDMTLARTYGGKGNFIYITENGAPDPTEMPLVSEGVAFDFEDPNGAAWHVEEAFSETVRESGEAGAGGVEGVSAGVDRTYVWIVELSAQPINDVFAGSLRPGDANYHTIYNFVAMVDTCKFHRTKDDNWNYGQGNPYQKYGSEEYDYNITHDADTLTDKYGHKVEDGVHTHEAWLANIYLGKRPHIVPSAEHPQGVSWTSTWTVGGSD